MPNEPLAIAQSQKDGIELLAISGPLTLSNLFDFQNAVRSTSAPKTIIDLSGVPYMDSAGLGALLGFHASCSRNNKQYAIAGTAPRLMTMFEVSKVVELLHLYPTIPEAEASLE